MCEWYTCGGGGAVEVEDRGGGRGLTRPAVRRPVWKRRGGTETVMREWMIGVGRIGVGRRRHGVA